MQTGARAPFPEKAAFVCSKKGRRTGLTPSTLLKAEDVSRRANGIKHSCNSAASTAGRPDPSAGSPLSATASRTTRSRKHGMSRWLGLSSSWRMVSSSADGWARPSKISLRRAWLSRTFASAQSCIQPVRGITRPAERTSPAAGTLYDAWMLASSVRTEPRHSSSAARPASRGRSESSVSSRWSSSPTSGASSGDAAAGDAAAGDAATGDAAAGDAAGADAAGADAPGPKREESDLSMASSSKAPNFVPCPRFPTRRSAPPLRPPAPPRALVQKNGYTVRLAD